MFAFLMSLTTVFAPLSPVAPDVPVASAPLAWLNGTWRTDALELTCRGAEAAILCREEGRSAAMKGASADLAITPIDGQRGSQLKVTLPGIPASRFREIARDAQSVTYQMPTKLGIARLRFTREGDVLKLERGDEQAFAATMTYRKG